VWRNELGNEDTWSRTDMFRLYVADIGFGAETGGRGRLGSALSQRP